MGQSASISNCAIGFLGLLLVAGPSFGEDGIIVRAAAGERLMNGINMMLSPNVGTTGAILGVLQR